MARPKKKKELDIDYTEYPRKVLSGEIVAGEYVRLSCQRFLDWMERKDIEFRKDKVDHVVNFISKLKHYKGSNAGQHFKLEPFQQWLTAGIFGFYWKGTDKRVVRNVWIELSRKNGKDININTPIITPSGWRTMEDIHVGDYVYSVDGKPTRVTNESPIYTDHECFEITFMNGEKVIAGAEHQWTVTKYHKNTKTMTTIQLFEDGVTNIRKDGYMEYKYALPRVKPLEFEEQDTPIDPYTFGVWLGDGTTANFQLNLNGDDVEEICGYIPYEAKNIKRCQNENCFAVSYRWNDEISKYINSFKTKSIPSEYLFNSHEKRLALLQGLMDTDGTVTPNPNNNGVMCEFVQKNDNIADGLCFLLSSFGIKYKRVIKTPTIDGEEKDDVNRITFSVDKSFPLFKLTRKQNKLKDKKKSGRIVIKSIERVETVKTKCIEVDNPSHLYLIGNTMIPTHNSFFASAIALYGLIADGEQGSEVDFVANTRKQAGIAFEMAHTMAKQLDPTGKILKRYRDQIKFPYTNSVLQVLSSDSNSNDGFNSHITVCDEVHAYGVDSSGSNGMVQVMRSSQGNRTNPLMIYITTAGFNLYGFAFPFRSTILEVLKGKKKDDTLFAAIYCLDAEDDYADENVWIKANPNLDVTCSRDYLKQQVEQAKNMVSFEISTRTKNFNEWLSMSDVDAWIDQASLINVTRKWDYNMFNGREVFAYMGLDLSAVSDLTALSTMVEFDNKMWFKVEYFLPEDALKKGPNAEQYKEWHRLGFLNVTDGNVVNYDAVAKKISDINQSMPISMVAYDKWNSIPFLSTFQNMGLPMQPYSQSIGNFSIASKELERRIKRGEVILDDNPITRWCYDNVILKTDWNDNIKPIKSNKSSEKKIDGVIAMIQSLGGWLATNHYGAEIFVV